MRTRTHPQDYHRRFNMRLASRGDAIYEAKYNRLPMRYQDYPVELKGAWNAVRKMYQYITLANVPKDIALEMQHAMEILIDRFEAIYDAWYHGWLNEPMEYYETLQEMDWHDQRIDERPM